MKARKIPKIIHYCWFGKNKKNKRVLHCINSWKKYCPDYKIIEWNEHTFDLSSAPIYVQEAYKCKKWAFVSDYVRLWALYKYGGVYLDADVELIKPLDRFLIHDGFSGFSEIKEGEFKIPAAVMGAKKGNPYIKYLLSYYKRRRFIKDDGSLDLKANVYIITEMTLKKFPNFRLDNSYQEIDNFVYYPRDFFTPKLKYHNHKPLIKKETYAIHYHNESWMPAFEKLKIKLLIILEYLGLKGALRKLYRQIKNKKK